MILIPEGKALKVEITEVRQEPYHNSVKTRTVYTIKDEAGNTDSIDQNNVGRKGWTAPAKVGDTGTLRYVPFASGGGHGMHHELELDGE